jgi:hypothetical protein
MRKRALLATAVLICAMLLTGMAANEARAFDIKFDGFCDGMTLNFEGGQIWGTQTGCLDEVIMGNLAKTFDPVSGFVMEIATTSGGLVGTYYLKFDRTFSNYWTDGVSPPFFNVSGTWSPGTPSNAAAGLPATVPSIPE